MVCFIINSYQFKMNMINRIKWQIKKTMRSLSCCNLIIEDWNETNHISEQFEAIDITEDI